MSADQITQEEIESAISFSRRAIELHESRSAPWAKAIIALADERDSLRAEVQRLTEDVEQAHIELEDERERVNVQREDIRTLRLEVQRLTEELTYVRGIMQGQEAECRAREEQDRVWRFKVETLTRSLEEARRSDAGRVEVPERRELALLRQHWQLWEEECCAEDPAVFQDKANAREEVDALLREHMTRSRLSPSPQPATGEADCASRELRELLGRVINAHIPGQGIALADWERACLLSGRFDQPMPDWEASPQPSADVVVVRSVPLEEMERRVAKMRQSKTEAEHYRIECLFPGGAREAADLIDALRSSTNHDSKET